MVCSGLGSGIAGRRASNVSMIRLPFWFNILNFVIYQQESPISCILKPAHKRGDFILIKYKFFVKKSKPACRIMAINLLQFALSWCKIEPRDTEAKKAGRGVCHHPTPLCRRASQAQVPHSRIILRHNPIIPFYATFRKGGYCVRSL